MDAAKVMNTFDISKLSGQKGCNGEGQMVASRRRRIL
jgi:hypothetical protein